MNKKKIRATITLVGDEFDDSGNNIMVIENMRIIAEVRFGGGNVMPVAEISIFGLNIPTMQKLMRIRWRDLTSMMNIIKLEAGEHNENLNFLYEGNITFAYIDFTSVPDVALKISSMTSILPMYKRATPISYEGEKSVVEAIREITEDSIGYSFTNDGVPTDLMMKNVTLVETDFNKIKSLCDSYKLDLYVEHGSITITPRGEPRNLLVPVLTPKSGMIGYAVPTIVGVNVSCFWDTNIKFGGKFRIEDSSIDITNGEWRAYGIVAYLESELPDGRWFMDIEGSSNSAAVSKS